MATYIKESSPAADAARLNLLEEKVRNLAPAEGTPSDIVEALNRLYDMTMRGGMHTDGDVTSDLADGFFWMRQQSISEASKKSLVSVTYGNTDTLNRVKDIPFLHQVLGVDAAWNFTKSAPSGDQDGASVVGNIWGHTSIYADMKARDQSVIVVIGAQDELTTLYNDLGSVWRAMYGISYIVDPEASDKSLLDIIRGLKEPDRRSRITCWMVRNSHMSISLITDLSRHFRALEADVIKAAAATLNSTVFEARDKIISTSKRTFDRPKEWSTSKAWLFTKARPADGARMSPNCGQSLSKPRCCTMRSMEVSAERETREPHAMTSPSVPTPRIPTSSVASLRVH
ncbi:hypothetical protein [Rhizobium laguerreae]|uniref:hypothetical protein n=1 Tax=Rhizobium laguerreae TaxID=1076926 RepID=UPI001C914ECF|nr:hypothetical protein [Rhizobium laguerreae]MBY3224813.1 hypothetical protein [Rhizobium laguerreae]